MNKIAAQKRDRAAREFWDLLDGLGWMVVGEYVNNQTPVGIICPEGHELAIARKDFQSLCPVCKAEKASQANRYSDKREHHF